MDGGGGGGKGASFGSQGSPGFVSPFDQSAVNFGQGQSMTAMADRYAQLGLSAHGATPASPGGPAGGIGVGNIGQPINFPGAPSMAPGVGSPDLPKPGSSDMFGFSTGGQSAGKKRDRAPGHDRDRHFAG